MRVEAGAVIMTMEVSGSNAAIARDSVPFVALNVAESDLCRDQIRTDAKAGNCCLPRSRVSFIKSRGKVNLHYYVDLHYWKKAFAVNRY